MCDDQKLLRAVLKESILQLRDDVEILEAEDGLSFLALMDEQDVDLAFLDVEMPNLDGFQALERLRAQESDGSSRAKVVMVTAMAAEENIVKGWELEADGYISKPYDVDEIREALEQHLNDSVPS